MDRKKLFRSWWPWAIIIAVLLAFLVLPSVAGSSTYSSVNTSDAVNQIQAGNVTKATVHDKEQTLDLDLKSAFNGHTKISTSYPADATSTIFNSLTSSKTNFT